MTGIQFTRRGGFTVDAPPAQAFPLFTPEEEVHWADGWTFRRIFPAGDQPAEGVLFSTSDVRGREMIWRIQALEPPRKVEYFNVTAGSHTTEITIELAPARDGKTAVSVEYRYTPFTEEGAEFLRPMTNEAYREWMKTWEAEIRHYLATGTTLRHAQRRAGEAVK